MIKTYAKVWLMTAQQEFQQMLSTRTSAAFFFIGKLFRFIMFFLVLILLKRNVPTLAGYTINAVIVFFLTFNIVDMTTQMFFRGVYQISRMIRTGGLDKQLTQPMSVLFRLLFGSPDLNDFIIFIPFLGFSIWFLLHIQIALSFWSVLLYLLLLFNALAIAMSFHIFVICFGMLTTEVDNTILLYRDLAQMGRLPTEIYREPLRFAITFIIPIGVMMNVPARVLLGTAGLPLMLGSLMIAIVAISLALIAWKYALRAYTSASS